jgi:hypothetical protein
VISAYGRNAILKQITLIKLAEESETIKYFYPSEYGTDIEYGPQSPTEPPHQAKLKVRKYIQDNVKRLQYTYLVTGPYPEGFIGPGMPISKAGGFNVPEKKAVLLGDGKGKVSFTTMPEYVDEYSLWISLTPISQRWKAPGCIAQASRGVAQSSTQGQLFHCNSR